METGRGNWTALLLAGHRPGVDALAAAGGVPFKGALPVAGTPMLTRVAEVLLACPEIARVVVAVPPGVGADGLLPADSRLSARPAAKTIGATVRAFATGEAAWPLLVTTADHALLRREIVRDFLAGVDGADVAVGAVEKSVVSRRFPASRRTWLSFRDGRYTGANLFALTGPGSMGALALWARAEQDRKKGRRMLGALGPGLMLGAALRLFSAQGVLDRAGRRLGSSVRLVALADPLAAIDVDSAADMMLAEAILSGRA